MSYAETENEHHEAISTGIVALRNEVAKLTASAHNMRGQGLACDDAERARALYESSAAYADAAYRVGTIVNDFEQAESYRAGAMEAIGPVPTYDALEQQALSAERAAKSSRERAEFLEGQIGLLDEVLGGEGRASAEEVIDSVAATARAVRRFRGIRDSAVNLLDKVGGQYSGHTLLDLMTILLDGDAPETLAKFKAQVVKPEPLLVKIPEGLAEAAKRVTQPRRYDPSVGEIVTGHDVMDVDGELTTGKITYVDADFVTVELARHRAQLGWHLGYASLDRTELRPANAQESNAWTRNLQLLREQNPAALKDSALLLEPDHLVAQVHGVEPEATTWVPQPGQIVVALDNDGKRAPVQFVALDTQRHDQAIFQLPGKLETADGVEYVWETRRIDVANLRPALPHEMNAFTGELKAKGLDAVIR